VENGAEEYTTKYIPQQRATEKELNEPMFKYYRALLAMGLPQAKAQGLAGISGNALRYYRDNDPDFRKAEAAVLPHAQLLTFAQEQELTNRILAGFVDKEIILAALEEDGIEGLTDKQLSYLRLIRSKQTPLHAPVTEQTGVGGVNLTINLGEQEVQSIEARRAVAKQLLQDFDASKKYSNPDEQLAIEGEILAED